MQADKKDALLKDSIIMFAATSIVNLSNFGFHMYATRSLGPEGYGILAAMLGLLVIVSMPAVSLQLTLAKKTAVFKAHERFGSIEHLFKKASKWFFFLGVGYFVFFFLTADLLGTFLNIDDKILVYILGMISIASLLMPVVRGILQGLQKFIGLGANLIIDAVLRIVFLFLFIWFGWGVRGAMGASFFSALCAFAAGFAVLSFIFRYKEENADVITKRELFKYAFPVFFSMLGLSVLSYLDLIMVKHFYSREEAGFYAVTSIVGKAFLFFPGAVVMTLFPKVSEQHELNRDTIKMLYKGLALTAGISAIGIAFCFFLPDFVIWMLAGGGRYYEISGVVKVFGAAILPLVLFNVVINYSLAVQKYTFIYIMFAGIMAYAALLWFFHGSFFQVLAILFIVNLVILAASLISLGIKTKRRTDF
ncbi:MAG: oligosaccharide flippase family protein [Candidatus Goldiibacteriota bacterium]